MKLLPCSTFLLLGTTLGLSFAATAADAPAAPSAPTSTAAPAAAPAAEIPKAPGFPADYKGKPYKGTPQEIPGRVEFENFDEGGLNVGFNTQHHEGDSSGKAYRDDAKPQICVTSATENDKFVDGKKYPSEDKESYYIGYTRPNDWVKCTVNVKKAGVYRVNTTAANETKKMTFAISFNDVEKAKVNGEGTGNYHIWKAHENICTVKLDAGLQVMKFQIGSEPHMNYDFLEFVYDEKASAEAAAAPAPAPKATP
jgi:hypothetical protein